MAVPGAAAALPPLTVTATLRWDVVSRLLPERAEDVLEIGSGQGAVAARLAARYPRFVGLEPDASSCAVAAERVRASGRGEMRQGSLERLAPDERFDLVCAFEVIEHIEHDGKALAEWAALLRPGGTLVLSTPAHQRLFGPSDELVGHFRRYEPDDLAALLRAAGLDQVRVVHYGFPVSAGIELVRNRLAGRRLAAQGPGSVDERTAASGRTFQPDSPLKSAVYRSAAAPWTSLQRRFPARGRNLVAVARRPAGD